MGKHFQRAVSLLLLTAGTAAFGAPKEQARSWNDDLEKWRAQRASALTAADGWLTVVGLDWLKHGENSIGTAADDSVRVAGPGNTQFGTIDLEGDVLTLKAPQGGFPAVLQVDGHAAHEQAIEVDGRHPTQFTEGTVTFFVIHRGDQYAVRVKDSQAAARLGFHGLNWYAPNPEYVVEADWEPYAQPREVAVENAVGITTKGLVPGAAHFHLGGQELTLEPVVEDLNEKSLMFVLRDATSGKTTYAASRFLYARLPEGGLAEPGKITLDFNRLVNPPCAFTPYATCPLPLASNRLKVALEAGEKKYDH